MRAYIALTTPEWISAIKALEEGNAIFWRKKQSFKAIDIGEKIYFLQRGSFSSNKERFVVGSGIFSGQEMIRAEEAWEKYGLLLGLKEKELFLDSVKKMYKESNPLLSCLQLRNTKFYAVPVSLASANVDFSPYTVSGKIISEAECSAIEELSCNDGIK